MFGLLKKREQRIIHQIHHDFDTAEDRLLTEARNIINNSKKVEVSEKEKLDTLKRLGFIQHAMVIEEKAINEENDKRTAEAGRANGLEATIIAHRMKSPYKFITTEELNTLCRKYNLIYASVKHYTGGIPEKNLLELKNCASIHPDFQPLRSRVTFTKFIGNNIIGADVNNHMKDGVTFETNHHNFTAGHFILSDYLNKKGFSINSNTIYAYAKYELQLESMEGLFIAAPKRDFNLKGLSKSQYAYAERQIIQFRDPVVFRYVKGGLEILTKWGIEASDPIVVNETHN